MRGDNIIYEMASKNDKDVVLDLAKYSDQRVRVKFQVIRLTLLCYSSFREQLLHHHTEKLASTLKLLGAVTFLRSRADEKLMGF